MWVMSKLNENCHPDLASPFHRHLFLFTGAILDRWKGNTRSIKTSPLVHFICHCSLVAFLHIPRRITNTTHELKHLDTCTCSGLPPSTLVLHTWWIKRKHEINKVLCIGAFHLPTFSGRLPLYPAKDTPNMCILWTIILGCDAGHELKSSYQRRHKKTSKDPVH